jgi:hypothetical protein
MKKANKNENHGSVKGIRKGEFRTKIRVGKLYVPNDMKLK